jgi:hypothetical protein
MQMKYLIFIVIVLSITSSEAQHKEDYIWMLGFNTIAFKMDFNKNPLALEETFIANAYSFDSNNASICNADGELLFYTNGCAVLNRDFEVMPNGDSLNFDIYMELSGWDNCEYGYLGIQDIMILPDPSDQEGYYIIHKPRMWEDNDVQSDIWISYVDMSLDGRMGDVVYKNVPIYTGEPLSSYLTAINHSNGKDWWIIQGVDDDSIFVTFLIDEVGVHRMEDQNSHVYFTENKTSASGTARFSPDGTMYAMYNEEDGLLLYDFDRNTGLVDFRDHTVTHDTSGFGIYCSVEWSPNSRFLYTASRTRLYQVDTWEEDLSDGVRLIDSYNGTLDPFPTTFFLMAQGPDCRIYMCPTSSTNSYHVINKPDELGIACDFRQNGVKLPNTTGVASFPNFPRFRVDEDEKCDSTISLVLGEEVYYRRDLKVYPSPSTGIYTVELPDSWIAGDMMVLDIQGNIIEHRHIPYHKNIETLDITNHPAGRYNIELYPSNKKDRIFYGIQVLKI